VCLGNSAWEKSPASCVVSSSEMCRVTKKKKKPRASFEKTQVPSSTYPNTTRAKMAQKITSAITSDPNTGAREAHGNCTGQRQGRPRQGEEWLSLGIYLGRKKKKRRGNESIEERKQRPPSEEEIGKVPAVRTVRVPHRAAARKGGNLPWCTTSRSWGGEEKQVSGPLVAGSDREAPYEKKDSQKSKRKMTRTVEKNLM